MIEVREYRRRRAWPEFAHSQEFADAVATISTEARKMGLRAADRFSIFAVP
jgi:hypothetical protein